MENILNYFRNAKKGKEGFVFEFENYDKVTRGNIVKYNSGGRREIDIAKVTCEIIKERILRGDTSGSSYYPIREIAIEVLKLAPYASEQDIKMLMVENRGSMVNGCKDTIKKVDLEEKIKYVANKNANKCGFQIPNVSSISNSQFEGLTYELWEGSIKQIDEINKELVEFLKENQETYFKAAGRRGSL